MKREKIATLFEEIDQGLKIILSANISDEIDLCDIRETGNLFEAALARHFETLLRNEGCGADIDGGPNDALLRRIAGMQADIFMLKAAFAGRDGASATLEAAYRDPLALARMLAAGSVDAADDAPSEPLRIPFEPQILCGGWSAPERGADGRVMRWMTHEARASVVLPALGPGRHAVEAHGVATDPAWFDELEIVCLGGAVENASRTRAPDGALRIDLMIDLPPDYANGFMFLELSGRSRPAPETFGLSAFQIRRAPAAAPEI